ncbi:lipopolysaccharide biosynthesis protein [Dietzia sp. ANT_WB102]|uniref:lipopolysaccharide biosynthesis protein n=1 Tax=Dietzia sp. ANT_WB102 TaxID=2597345 RepID=UPI0011ED168A|nr:oligosaccharide flippase family protein [Dietzia sp. ANT_WB102]KAA0918898.1 oligosaccharide flippase family protein [Dietzia sp. ANT_WB102]
MFKTKTPKPGRLLKSVLTLAGGTAAGQVVTLGAYPVLTRIYSPEEMGIFAVFFALVSILGIAVSGRYELAVLLPESDDYAVKVAKTGVRVAAAISILLFGVVLVASSPIAGVLGERQLAGWLFLIPPIAFLTGLFNVLNFLNNRAELYPALARVQLSRSFVVATCQVLLGLAHAGPAGLIVGQAVGVPVATLHLARSASKAKIRDVETTWRDSIEIARRYRQFPLYSAPAALANTGSVHITNILVGSIFSTVTLGFFSLAQRALGLPTMLVVQAISQVFLREATRRRHSSEPLTPLFDQFAKRLGLLAVPLFVALFFISPSLFGFVFGSEWRVAGEYCQLLVPLFAARFVANGLATVTAVLERQIVALSWQVAILLIAVSCAAAVAYAQGSIELFLVLFSISGAVAQFSLLVTLRKLCVSHDGDTQMKDSNATE